MPAELITLPNLSDELTNLIKTYNLTPIEHRVDRLFYLQKINYFLKQHLDDELVMEWRNQVGDSGWEHHLQVFGIHKDASPLLQSIEFAQALIKENPKELPSKDFYSALKGNTQLFKSEGIALDEETRQSYLENNKNLLIHYNHNLKLRNKVLRHKEVLNLSYAKIEAIQGLVQEHFDTYDTKVLGKATSRNKNFLFTIDADENMKEQFVFRVEDRESLDHEEELNDSEVSDYFSQDYVTLMLPFGEGRNKKYRPVVLSEFAAQGDLEYYAKGQEGKNPKEILTKTKHFFKEFNDFNLKLMKSGHYHPDLKLSNFLTDGRRLIISDRKTFTDEEHPKANTIESTEAFAAPEYRKCLLWGGKMNANKAKDITINMPSYMAFQTGVALKEWMLLTQMMPWDGTEEGLYEQLDFWSRIYKEDAPNELKNYSVLIQELTRSIPEERLSLENFQTLLAQIHLSPQEFIQKLEELSPQENLTVATDLKNIEAFFKGEGSYESIKEKLEQGVDFELLCQDPRLDLGDLLKGKPKESLTNYLNEVDALLLEVDLKNSSPLRRLLHNLSNGFISVDRKSSVKDIELPPMYNLTKATFIAARVNQGSEIKAEQKKLFEAIGEVMGELDKNKETSAATNLKTDTTVKPDLGTSITAESGTSVKVESGTTVLAESGTSLKVESGTTVLAESGTSVISQSGTSVKASTSANNEGYYSKIESLFAVHKPAQVNTEVKDQIAPQQQKTPEEEPKEESQLIQETLSKGDKLHKISDYKKLLFDPSKTANASDLQQEGDSSPVQKK